MEVTSRFGEQESKAHFRHLLRSIGHAEESHSNQDQTDNQNSMVRLMQNKSRLISKSIKEHLPKLLHMWKEVLQNRETGSPIFSLDVAEATALAVSLGIASSSSISTDDELEPGA